MKNLLRAIPALISAVVIAMETSPQALVSNLSAWASLSGIRHIPGWAVAPRADTWVVIGSIVIAVLSLGWMLWPNLSATFRDIRELGIRKYWRIPVSPRIIYLPANLQTGFVLLVIGIIVGRIIPYPSDFLPPADKIVPLTLRQVPTSLRIFVRADGKPECLSQIRLNHVSQL